MHLLRAKAGREQVIHRQMTCHRFDQRGSGGADHHGGQALRAQPGQQAGGQRRDSGQQDLALENGQALLELPWRQGRVKPDPEGLQRIEVEHALGIVVHEALVLRHLGRRHPLPGLQEVHPQLVAVGRQQGMVQVQKSHSHKHQSINCPSDSRNG